MRTNLLRELRIRLRYVGIVAHCLIFDHNLMLQTPARFQRCATCYWRSVKRRRTEAA